MAFIDDRRDDLFYRILDERRERVDIVAARFRVDVFPIAYDFAEQGPLFQWVHDVRLTSRDHGYAHPSIEDGIGKTTHRAHITLNRWRPFGVSRGWSPAGPYGVLLLERQPYLPTVDAGDFRWSYWEELHPLNEEAAAWLVEQRIGGTDAIG